MIIGIDFDNTIVDYTGVFHATALAAGWIPENVGASKACVKQFFMEAGQEKRWTELQGIVYGREIMRACAYDGVIAAISLWARAGHKIVIVSHKTPYPVIGEKTLLQEAARNWLVAQGVVGAAKRQIAPEDVFFGETLDEKVALIQQKNCDVFIDDLPMVFEHPSFPATTRRVLFAPATDKGSSACAHLAMPHWRLAPDVLKQVTLC